MQLSGRGIWAPRRLTAEPAWSERPVAALGRGHALVRRAEASTMTAKLLAKMLADAWLERAEVMEGRRGIPEPASAIASAPPPATIPAR